jgi:2-methylisocitrate lyase-like PEP mutase family enzyme
MPADRGSTARVVGPQDGGPSNESRVSLRARLRAGEFITAIGAHDALSARQVEQAGFEAVYLGSYATEAAMLGRPDLSLMTRTERALVTRHVSSAVDIPVIVDMEEGFGNAIATKAAMRELEAAGATAVHIDDQALPGMCPFLPAIPDNSLISIREMQGKIAAAVDGRRSSDTLVIARCDVVATMERAHYYESDGISQVIRRSNAYRAAGADAIFVMAFDRDELARYRAEIDGPLVGIFAPAEPLAIDEFRRAGFQMTIGSLVSLYSSIRGVAAALQRLRETGDWNQLGELIVGDEDFFDLVKLDEIVEEHKRYDVR